MTLRTTVFIATSLDGYIARTDGAIDWLEQANQHVPAGEDCGYAAHMATVDHLGVAILELSSLVIGVKACHGISVGVRDSEIENGQFRR